ncbi:hypothetical protein ACOSQ2_013475 [Xanthoceras sorbifolium]
MLGHSLKIKVHRIHMKFYHERIVSIGRISVRSRFVSPDHLIGLNFGMGTLDDMNHLKNKRIRSVADLLQDQFGLALVRLENVVRGTIGGAIRHKWMPTPQNLVTSTPLTTTYDSFFGLHPL